MYDRAPAVPGRGLGTGLLAGFLASIIGIALACGAVLLASSQVIALAAITLGFAVPVGASAWLVRPTSWAVPPLFAVLSLPGYFVAELCANIVYTTRAHNVPISLILHSLSRPAVLSRFFEESFTDGRSLAFIAVMLVIVLAMSLTAVLYARSRAGARMRPAGGAASGPPGRPAPPPGPYLNRPPYPNGPSPQGLPHAPPVSSGGPVFPGPPTPAGPVAHRPPPAPSPAYGPAAPYGPPGPPPGPPATPPPGPPPGSTSGSAPGGTRRLDPDEFDQMLYEAEQERRARED